MKHGADRLLESLSADQLGRLAEFLDLLRSRAIPRGLIARSDADRIWERHVLDSLRAIPCLAGAKDLADLGSGAGIPGIPLAVASPDTEVALIESRRTRGAFLELVVERLQLASVKVLTLSAREVARAGHRFGVVTARAVADGSGSWGLAEPLLRPGGRLLYFSGLAGGSATAPAEAVVDICRGASLPGHGSVVIMRRRLETER